MRDGTSPLVVFRPSPMFPNECAPDALPGWYPITGDAGSTLYRQPEGARAVAAQIAASPVYIKGPRY
jgi:hypothetical protein